MGSLIRATNLFGVARLMRVLGDDPAPFLTRFHIPPGVEHEEDAFVPYKAAARMLEASVAEVSVRTSGFDSRAGKASTSLVRQDTPAVSIGPADSLVTRALCVEESRAEQNQTTDDEHPDGKRHRQPHAHVGGDQQRKR
jgi:hypothetical protein